jgi:hypothetical protein
MKGSSRFILLLRRAPSLNAGYVYAGVIHSGGPHPFWRSLCRHKTPLAGSPHLTFRQITALRYKFTGAAPPILEKSDKFTGAVPYTRDELLSYWGCAPYAQVELQNYWGCAPYALDVLQKVLGQRPLSLWGATNLLGQRPLNLG